MRIASFPCHEDKTNQFHSQKFIKMKNSIFVITILSFLISTNLFSQGWIGNSNNLIAYNSTLGLTPINVGIGLSSPTALFHTNGTLRFQGLTQTNSFSRFLVTDPNGNVNWRDISSINFSDNDWDFTTNAPNMFSINTGNVGIGVNTPTEKLDLAGNIRLTTPTDPNAQMFIRPSISVTGNLNPGVDTESVVAGQITNRLFTHLVIDILANDIYDSFAIRTDQDTDGIIDNIAMVVRPNGNIGIGTNAPNAQLHTTGSVRFQGLQSGGGNNLVVDADGNVRISGCTCPSGTNVNVQEEIKDLKLKVNQLERQITELKKLLEKK